MYEHLDSGIAICLMIWENRATRWATGPTTEQRFGCGVITSEELAARQCERGYIIQAGSRSQNC